ncbi:TnpV protein [Subdoligranulum sp. AM16-9]|uniref:TnpV protein n=3 Tax=Ruthenibacterium TaxID=1905344 RepID=A0A6L6LTZ8_9FIRM|nr:TnpV protein [Ruthenibacterium lactatiformans]RGC96956.1 TnpV protein [Subdoligranulum sp. AM16-9]MTQ80552.1 TnpV protein [Ruthenibacterium lactatiformans]MTS20611.1 TnpV protein [Ruthenibacterium lactatiformans]MTS27729.1 TnpV protein [Ruthenibacterium lactatiformans]
MPAVWPRRCCGMLNARPGKTTGLHFRPAACRMKAERNFHMRLKPQRRYRTMTYTTRNGVRYPDLMLEEPEAAPGKYGLLRLRYLEKSDPDQLNILLLEGALNSHLAQIDRQVRGQVEQTMERLVQRTRLPDKQTDPLGWAGTMNSLRQQAEETAMELIYGS